MAKVESKNKQNPKLVQSELLDGQESLALEFYLGRNETPVLYENGNHVLYTEGAMKRKLKYKVKHIRKREVLNLYIWQHPRNQQERTQNKNTLALAEKIRFEREQEFLEDREGYRLKKNGENDFIKYFRKHWENELYSNRKVYLQDLIQPLCEIP
ncbi:MAG: integrase [Duncaniella sp.]|nr:integrase [Duncaniella sp.]